MTNTATLKKEALQNASHRLQKNVLCGAAIAGE